MPKTQPHPQATKRGRDDEQPAQAVFELQDAADWREIWQKFLAIHEEWWRRFGPGPVYSLPEPVIRHLAKTRNSKHRPRRALINSTDKEAEHAFRGACQQFRIGTVGVWDGNPIRYDLLAPTPRLPEVSKEQAAALGWDYSPSHAALQREYDHRATPWRRRLLGYVGYLTFDRTYQAERDAIKSRWLALAIRPSFPLYAAPSEAVAAGRKPHTYLPEEVDRFLGDVAAFLRKWQLAGLETWELPHPQGPLSELPAGLVTQLLGADHILSAVPASFTVPSSEDERKSTLDRQREAARLLGLPKTFPVSGLGGRRDPSLDEGSFRLWFVEQAVRSRHTLSRGLALRLKLAFIEMLGISEERIKQLRRHYLPHVSDRSALPPLAEPG